MSTVLLLLAEGFEEAEAIVPADILRRGEVAVVTASISGDRAVKGAHGVVVVADALLSEVAAPAGFDAVVVPGGNLGHRNLLADRRVAEILAAADAAGRIVAAICAGPRVLAAAGVVRGRRFTCYPSCEAGIDGDYDDGAPVVEDGNLVTSRGPGTAPAFGLALLGRLAGPAVAATVAAGMLL